jgi:hypothetical protein
MQINEKILNDFIIKPVKISKTNDENILGKNMFETLYSNIFIIARKKSGKSNVIYNIIDKGADKRTNILFFVPTFYVDPVYQELEAMLIKKKINYEVFTDIIEDKVNILDQVIDKLENPNEESEEEEPTHEMTMFGKVKIPKKAKEPKFKSPEHIIILDDIGQSLRNSAITRLLKINRHLHARVIISSQNQSDLYYQSFRQLDYILVFRGLSSCIEKLKAIYDNADLNITFNEFLELYRYATAEPYTFLYIDVRHCNFRKNFNILLSLK